MTIASRELFELCKEVYERTKWGRMDNGSPTDEYYVANPVSIRLNKPDVVEGWQIWRWEDFGESGRLHYKLGKEQAYPLYTSDYLLEKLPFPTEIGCDSFTWIGKYENRGKQVWERADTPLKALLRLTLKLHEENIL